MRKHLIWYCGFHPSNDIQTHLNYIHRIHPLISVCSHYSISTVNFTLMHPVMIGFTRDTCTRTCTCSNNNISVIYELRREKLSHLVWQ